ncbi:MAG TPA: iron-sulfur cluster insertion protein ErpA [Paenibacillaceae bacterium]
MIRITEAASEKIRQLLEEEGSPDLFLRLGVRPGGCSGFSYGMGFDDERHEDDRLLEINGLKVVVDENSYRFLDGVEIDWRETAMGGGFTIHNPNAIATCGCGQSFRTATEAGKPEQC